MKKLLVPTIVLCCSCAVFAETRVWSGAGDNALLSNAENWQGDVAPSVAGDVLEFRTASATRVENDVAGFTSTGLSLINGDYTLAGLPWTVLGNVSVGADAGAAQTFDADLLFSGWSRSLTVPANHTVVFNGNLGHADTTGCSVHLNGAGTKVLRGGMKVTQCTDTDNDAFNKASRLQYGSFLVEGDVDLPRYILGHTSATDEPAHIVVTNGAMVRNWKAVNSFIQNCTIDLRGGRLVNDGNLIYAQDSRSCSRLNIFRDGVFSTGSSFRPGNNGVAEFTVEEGGTFYWFGGVFSENGRTTFTLNGGRLIRGGNGRDQLGIGQNPANDTSYQNIGGNVINFNGGEIWAGNIANNSNITRNKGTVTTFNCNGGTFMCSTSSTYWQGNLDSLALVAQAGGARMDTRGCNVTWNHGMSGEGGFTKLGVGTLTFGANQTFAGSITVRAGALALADPSFVMQRVELSPAAIFAPGGAASLAGLASTDGILRLVCAEGTPALTLAAAPEVEGTLFFELQTAASESLVTPGTYPVIAAPGLTNDFAAKCQARNTTADRIYTFAVVDGVLTVTVAEGTNPHAGAVASSWTAAAGGDWAMAANWSVGVPNGVDSEATLGGSGAGPVTLSQDATVAKLNFSGTQAYSVTGEGTLTFASSSGYTGVNVDGGTHEVAVPVAAGAPLRISTSNGGKLVLSGDVSGAKDLQVINGAVASPNLSTLPNFLLAEGTFEYTGTGAGTAEGALRQNGNGCVRQTEGAGPMTLKVAPYLSQECTLRLQGNGTSEIALDGTGWNRQPLNGRRIWLDGGAFRFLPGLRMVWDYTGSGMTRIGSVSFDRTTSVVVEDGARVQWREVWVGGERASRSAVSVEQQGGEIVLKSDLRFNAVEQTNRVDYVKTGGTLTGDAWVDFQHGPVTFRQTDGATRFAGLAFGLQNYTSYNFTNKERGGQGLLDLQGGTFAVSDNWNWLGDAGGRREDRVRVAGGELTLPATTRAVAYDAKKPASFSTLELAGGTVKFGGVGTAGSADDYLAGLNYLSLTGETTIDSSADATVTQPLVVSADATGFTKKGAGVLTLAATNDVPAKVSVEAGTLAATFRTDAKPNVPDGLLAFWTFDGEDPYRDVTGHGYDLVQAVDGVDVQFSEEKAHVGKSAWWQTPGAALKCTAFTSALLQRTTISLWVRLENKNYYKSHIGMFSMRNNLAGTGASTTFDLAYKGTINSTFNQCGIGNCFAGSPLTGIPKSAGGDISAQEWHMVTITRDEGRIRGYIDGVPCTDVNIDACRANTLLEQGRMITLGANIANSSGLGEMMNQNGRLDDVAIYSRCLSDAEVASLFAAQSRPSAADEVRVAQGATLDLRDSSLTASLLGGAGTVANGTVTASKTEASCISVGA